jgi:hypothetical protein
MGLLYKWGCVTVRLFTIIEMLEDSVYSCTHFKIKYHEKANLVKMLGSEDTITFWGKRGEKESA